jgi:hypothetical protein
MSFTRSTGRHHELPFRKPDQQTTVKVSMKNDENLGAIAASWNKSIDAAREEYGESSTPVFAQTLGKYFALEKHSIFSNIDEVKKQFVAFGGADKIVEKIQNELIEFTGYENDEEQEMLFLPTSTLKENEYSRTVVIAASLYLVYVCAVINAKYREVRDARSRLVSALARKNLRPEAINGASPTDLSNKDAELSRLFKLKRELKSLPKTFVYLGSAPEINPNLKIYEDEIPDYFPNLDVYKVYLAASFEFDENDLEKFRSFSYEQRCKFSNDTLTILPVQTWKYWRDEVEVLFDPFFGSPDE